MPSYHDRNGHSSNCESVSHVLDDLITSWTDCNRLREELDNASRRYGDLVTRLRPLAKPALCRQIYHDCYVPRLGYIGVVITIYANGAVHVSQVERATRVDWPKPDSGDVPELHHVANGGSIQSPLVPDIDGDSTTVTVSEKAWDQFWSSREDGDLQLTNEIVRTALMPDDMLQRVYGDDR